MLPQARKSGLLRRFAPRNDGRHSFAIPQRDALRRRQVRFNFQTAKTTVIASEAKQSTATIKVTMDCFVASAFAR
jgi:hypothetical protein